MKKQLKPLQIQRGMMLIEALMAILVFSLGVLGMMGVNAVAASTQSDAQYRNEANRVATRIVNEMWVNVDRTTDANLAASMATFVHRADVGACDTSADGTASTNALVTGWVADITGGGTAGTIGGLPGATNRMQQIMIPAGAGNQVIVTVCWKAPKDIAVRKHVVTSYIN